MRARSSIPSQTGIGLRAPHMAEILAQKPAVGFLEAHSENYFGASPARHQLLQLRAHYDISLHGVGLSLGRADDLDKQHLQQVADLVNEVQPLFVSEHIAWSGFAHTHVPDLLPLPMTEEALDILCAHIDQVQTFLGRQILVENPSSYVRFTQSDMPEPAFLATLAKRTGCGLLLDINNIFVSAHNTGFDAADYLTSLDTDAVREIHLAGYQENTMADGETLYIDTHGKPVYPAVWKLYEQALAQFGDVPTLVEWDSDIPPLQTLLNEAAKADVVRGNYANVG